MGVKNPQHSYTINGHVINKWTYEKDLGVWGDETGYFSAHIEALAGKTKHAAAKAKKMLRGASFRTRLHVWNTYLLPLGSYASQVFGKLNQKQNEIWDGVYRQYWSDVKLDPACAPARSHQQHWFRADLVLLKKIERGQSCLKLQDFSMIKRFMSTKLLRSQSVSEKENVSAVRSGDLYVDHRIGPRLSQVCPQKVAHIYNDMSKKMKSMEIKDFKIALDQSTILDRHCPSGKILSDKVRQGVLYSRAKAWRIKKKPDRNLSQESR